MELFFQHSLHLIEKSNSFRKCKINVTEMTNSGLVNHDNFKLNHFRELLDTKKRREDVCEHLTAVLGKNFINCELQLAGPEYERLRGFSDLPPAVAEELFSSEPSDKYTSMLQALSPSTKTVNKATITVDNLMSPVHTLLQIRCVDHKGLIYDVMRISKDCNIQVLSHEFLACCLTLLVISLMTSCLNIVRPDSIDLACIGT